MKAVFLSTLAAALVLTIAPANAHENYKKTATFTNSAVADSGSCTVEVMVPGAARVKIHGDTATLEHVSGRAPEWRRFECSSAMPRNPASFRVENVSGRGHEEMVHGPKHNGGSVVVYINDSKKGEDTYTFNVIWGTARTQ